MGAAFTVHFFTTVHGAPMLSEEPPGSQQSLLLWLFNSRYKSALDLAAFLQPFSSSLSACVSLQPRPLFSQPNLAWPPTRHAGHPGCHCASAVAPPAVHQDARAGDLQGQPQSISMHISTFPSLRRPCLAEAAHLHSQHMAAAHSHAATGTNLVTVLISFLI